MIRRFQHSAMCLLCLVRAARLVLPALPLFVRILFVLWLCVYLVFNKHCRSLRAIILEYIQRR